MSKRALFIASVIVALIILAVILAFNLNRPNSGVGETAPSAEIMNSKYLISAPNYGPILNFQKISVRFDGDKAIGTLSDKEASHVSKPQKVVLFDKVGFVQPLGGVVIDVAPSPNDDDLTQITIQLPEGTNTDLLSDGLEIITLETIASKRLPRSAIVKNDTKNGEGKNFVWVATPTAEDKTAFTLKRLYIDIGLSGLDFFEEGGFQIGSATLIILNPDDKIESDKTYRFRQVEFSAPLHNPIKQAWVDFELNRLDQQQKNMQEIADNCGKNNNNAQNATAGATSTPANDSCGASFLEDGATDPFAIFNALTNRQP